ncbi:MAG: hypothetical protein BRC29_03480 [Nanohaloarchaea archaeon SW_7_43_1]|nr:MAG: hypothetical protein BRC29_03480 [Nanohaloarchaea archaeon SW_7_43_1]
MTLPEDLEIASEKVREAQDILEGLKGSSGVRHTDPELLTSQELEAIRKRLDLPHNDLQKAVERLQEADSE